MNQHAGLLRLPHASATAAPRCDGEPRTSKHLESVPGTPETPVSHPDTDKDTDSRPSDCPSCVALRGTSRLLAEPALYLIDRNAELTRQLEAYRARDRRHAEMLVGLADLQKAAGA